MVFQNGSAHSKSTSQAGIAKQIMSLPLCAISVLMFFSVALPRLVAQKPVPVLRSTPDADADRDGISDRVEQSLLIQFAPRFMVSRQECSLLPAEFTPNLSDPVVRSEDGTIYGQVFPLNGNSPLPTAEIHFYHLWKKDCGAHSHPLDAEHVSVLVQASSHDLSSAIWKAVDWYAAAHEDTVCDVSEIARASTLSAEDHGATVWISAGKHASFFNERLCTGGCGGDMCRDMKPLHIAQIINLGEPDAPLNGSLWIQSNHWSLAGKMSASNFPDSAMLRLSGLPSTEIALFHAGRHPMQGTIAISNSTADALANSGNDTAAAMSVGRASTGNALRKSYHHTIHALGISADRLGKALHFNSNASPAP
jgi:hypothetical protein